MSDGASNRKLAAILASDVVGYSSLMAKDEAGTMAALRQHRAEQFDPFVAQHGGRIVKLMGDGALVEFGSVLDAVNCAVAVQQAVQAASRDAGSPIVLRIGINLGDVIIEGDDIYGNGVNIAARLEPLAKPGGICVSGIVKDSVEGRANVAFADGGPVQVKNIDRPIRVWTWSPDSDKPVATPTSEPQKASENGSIAVLPFENMSGDPEQEYFSDGISEDIITDLSKVSGLLVIARNSTFVYKGSNVDLRKVGRDLGVRTVLEGSVRKAGNRVRVTAQLIDAETGGHIWADRYDRDLTDIFEVQDEVTFSIVDALKVHLKPEEKERITTTGTTNMEAHECYLKGRSMLSSPSISKEIYYAAHELADRALSLDPNYGRVYLNKAFAEIFNQQNFWTEDMEGSLGRIKVYLDKAIAFDPDDPIGWGGMAIYWQHAGKYDEANKAAAHAVEVSPGNASALSALGTSSVIDGRPSDAIPYLEQSLRLDPSFGHQYLHFLGAAHFFLGNYDTAAELLRERLVLQPTTDNGRVMLASTLGWQGEREAAREVWRELCDMHPDFSFERRLASLPYRDPSYPQRIRDGLAKAGITELT